MASTWDTELVWHIGHAIGVESRNKGKGIQILLGPAVNIQRSPLGRTQCRIFQRRPFLAAQIAAVSSGVSKAPAMPRV